MKTLRNPNRKPTHPGAVLREDVLPGLGITQGRMAELLGVSRVTLAQLLHEHRALSGDMALRLERLLGTSAESWLNMQQAVDLWESRQDAHRFEGVQRLTNHLQCEVA
jgi:antitoxin HigA-1